MQLSENEKGIDDAHQMRTCIWRVAFRILMYTIALQLFCAYECLILKLNARSLIKKLVQLSKNEKGVHEAHQMRICIWKGCLQKISIHTKAHTKNLQPYEN